MPGADRPDEKTAASEDAIARRFHVVSAANVFYFPGLLVTFHSLLRHLAPGWAVDFVLLAEGLEERHLQTLGAVLRSTDRDFTLEVVEPDYRGYEACPLHNGSKLTYARLLIPKLVAADRVLYLDSDIVVTRDVSHLAVLPWPGENVLYAVRDARVSTPSMEWETIPWETLGIPPDAPYFNAGYVWVNLAQWRRQAVDEACMEYIRRFPDRLRWHDQSVLNAVLWNRWLPLEDAWNLAPERTMGPLEIYPFARRRDVNVHYVGKEKPWLERHPLEYFYWDAADEFISLAAGEIPVRNSLQRDAMKEARYFAYRAYLGYGSFCKRRLLKLFR